MRTKELKLGKVLGTREVYRTQFISVREKTVVGSGGDIEKFATVKLRPGSSVLALDRQGKAYLAWEYKQSIRRYSLEVLSGGLEPGESPREAARREAKEEAGLYGGKFVYMGVVNPFTSMVNSPNHMFLALNVKEGKSSPDPSEHIEIRKIPFDDAVQMVMRGRITHSASCVLILKAERYLKH